MNTTPHSRRGFLRAATGVSVAALTANGAATPKPHILWIIAEDFSADLPCYGDRTVATPNIDRLAAEGMRFNRAFMTAPVCSAARSALATGMYQTSIGAHHHRSHRDDGYRLPNGVRLFTKYLREAGYHTSNLRNRHGLHGTGKTDLNFTAEQPFDSDDWSDRKPGQPFYAQINFSETHRAFNRFPESPIDPVKVPVPPYYPDHPAVRLDLATYYDDIQHLDVKVGKVLQRLEEEELSDDTIVIFLGDHGRPFPRGKQFLYDEGIRIPLIVRIPPKYRVAGYTPGTVNDDLVSSIDVTATTLWLAGVNLPAHMEGQRIYGSGARKRPHIIAARDRCDETRDRIRCVRDKQFKYIRNYFPDRPYTQQNVYKDTVYPTLRAMRDLHAAGKLTGAAAQFMAPTRPAEEFYDLAADPHEITNLAGRPEHRKRIEQMRRTLDEWIRRSGDKGEIPEPELPAAEELRSGVDGWMTRAARLSRQDGVLRADFPGGGTLDILRSFAEPPGRYRIECRARSNAIRPSQLEWRLIDGMANGRNRVTLDFAANGEWQLCRAEFEAKSWLGLLTWIFDGNSGAIDFDWIRLDRMEGGDWKTAQSWRFSA